MSTPWRHHLQFSVSVFTLAAGLSLCGCGGGGGDGSGTVVPAGPAGAPDTTFGSDGSVATHVAVALQPDGKIAVSGTVVEDANDASHQVVILVRYTAAGALDPTFGSAGQVLMRWGTEYATSSGLVVQADGKIVVVANGLTSCGLMRFLSTGAIDPTFGTNGIVTIGAVGCGRIAQQKDGKMIVGAGDGHVFRLDPDGRLDTSFGSAGAVDLGVLGSCCNIVIASSGEIVASASARGTGLSAEFVGTLYATIRRIRQDGTIDYMCCTYPIGVGLAGPNVSLAVQDDGKVLYAAYSAVHRILVDGSVDATFGSGGAAGADNVLAVNSIALQSNGKIVAVGEADNRTMTVIRFDSSGAVDSTFGAGGTASGEFAAPSAGVGLAIQSDGRIVAVGNTLEYPGPNVMLATRFYGDPVQ